MRMTRKRHVICTLVSDGMNHRRRVATTAMTRAWGSWMSSPSCIAVFVAGWLVRGRSLRLDIMRAGDRDVDKCYTCRLASDLGVYKALSKVR